MAGEAIYLEIDDSDLQETLAFVKSRLSGGELEKCVRRAYRRMEGTARRVVGKSVPAYYEVPSGEASRAVGHATIAGMGCTIPIRAPRRAIGGQFKAKGQAHGWESLHKSYKVRAKILRGTWTVTNGNNFRNMPSSLGKQAYCRFGPRLPIKKVLGPAVPEMASHLAKGDIQAQISAEVQKRLLHEMQFLLSR